MIDTLITALIDKDTDELVRQYIKRLPSTIVPDPQKRKLFERLKGDNVDIISSLEELGIEYSTILESLESDEYAIFNSTDNSAKINNILTIYDEWKRDAVCKFTKDFERAVLSGKIDTNKAISQLQERVAALPTLNDDDTFISGVDSFLEGIYRSIDTGVTSLIPIPFNKLNSELNGGLRRKGIVVINGTTGMGKTMLAQNFVRFWAKMGMNILYVSTEMSKENLIARWVRQEGFDNNKMITDDMILKPSSRLDIHPIVECAQAIAGYNIHFCMLQKRIEDIKFAMHKRKYDIVVVDHMHQINGVDDPDQLEKILDEFNVYANQKDALILLLAQSRKEDSYGKAKSKPHLGSLRGSSKLIDICDFIGAIYEDEQLGTYMFGVLKDRHNGITGREIPLDFIRTACTLREKSYG